MLVQNLVALKKKGQLFGPEDDLGCCCANCRRGVAGTTLAAIGERAGYSRRLATHRFGSKAGLLAQVRDTTVADWIAQVPHIVGAKTGIAAVDSVVDVPSYF
jgi:Bacterial regulatory proteins, tetR family